jgi:hypothetical protein
VVARNGRHGVRGLILARKGDHDAAPNIVALVLDRHPVIIFRTGDRYGRAGPVENPEIDFAGMQPGRIV